MRYLPAPGSPTYGRAPEIFPHTRTSDAGSITLKYYLPWRAALSGQYRYYGDTWGIGAHTAEVEYTHPGSSGCSLVRTAFTRRTRRISSATCSPPSTRRTSWRATRKALR
ncbi:MAG: DUF3570 domain-containing protein [Pseudomonadota bacterium]